MPQQMKRNAITLCLVIICWSNSQAQCNSRKGIMNEACESLTIVTPPAFDLSLGISNTNIFKFDVNYITQDEIVYGGSVGVKIRNSNLNMPEDGLANVFLGYNLAGCIIVGVSAGITHEKNRQYTDGSGLIKHKTGIKGNIGMAMKFITTYTKIPITIGGYGSNAGIGLTIGTIF